MDPGVHNGVDIDTDTNIQDGGDSQRLNQEMIQQIDDSVSMWSRLFDLDGGKKDNKSAIPQGAAKSAKFDKSWDTFKHGKDLDKDKHDKDKQDHIDTKVATKSQKDGDGGVEAAMFGAGTKDMKGGGNLDVLGIFHKLCVLFLLLLISIVIAFCVFNFIFYDKYFNKNKDADYNFEDHNVEHAERHKKIWNVLLMFNIVILVSFLLVILVCYLFVLMYFHTIVKDPSMTGTTYFNNLMFWFNNNGEMIPLTDFFFSLVIILTLGYIIYVIYFKNVKDYFTSIAYPAYIDPKNSTKKEYENPKKFLLFYGLMILYIMAFALMLMNYVYAFDNDLISFIYNIIFIFFVLWTTGMYFKNILKKNLIIQSAFVFIIVLIISFNKNIGQAFKLTIETMINIAKRGKMK